MSPFEHLPFVIVATTGVVISNWNVLPTLGYDADLATGRRYFHELMMAMVMTGDRLLLVRVFAEQAKKQASWSGIELGFHSAMADELMADPPSTDLSDLF